MADVDFDKFLSETAPEPATPKKAAGVDFDKFLAETAPLATPKSAKSSVADAAMRGVSQGATLGFADEAVGALGGLYDYAQGKLGNRGDISLSDAYHTRRDSARRADEAAQAQHPVVYGAGQVGGALATSVVPGLGAINAGKGAGLAETVGKGVLQGSLAGAGEAKEITDVPQEAWNGGIVGGLVGGAVQGAGKLVGPAARAVTAQELETAAEQRAFKAAVGRNAKINTEIAGQGRTEQIGRDLLDSGTVGFGDNAAQIAAKAGTAKKAAGSDIDRILSVIDDQAAVASSNIGPPRPLVEGDGIANGLRSYAEEIGGQGNASTIHRLKELADFYEQRGPLSLLEAQTEKNSFKYRSGDLGATFDKEATNRVKSIIGDEMEAGVGRFQAQAQPNDPTLADYIAAKQNYGSQATAQTGAKKLAATSAGNATIGLLPAITGAASAAPVLATAAMHGNPIMAAGGLLAGGIGAGAHKLAQSRGNSALAVGLDKAADISGAVAPYVGPAADIVSTGLPLAITEQIMDPNAQKRAAIQRRIGK